MKYLLHTYSLIASEYVCNAIEFDSRLVFWNPFEDKNVTDLLTSPDIAGIIKDAAKIVHLNNTRESLREYAREQSEVYFTKDGTLAVTTGKFTGRSANDKFIVKDSLTSDTVWWDNANDMSTTTFDFLLADMLATIDGREMFAQQLQAGADDASAYNVQVFSPSAWHSLFIQNLLIVPEANDDSLANVTIVHLPDFKADPAIHNTKSETCIALDFTRNIVLICGTAYAGEIKKSVFSLFNFHAPDQNIFPMHCSANVDKDGDTTLFFGLSGTGKTTLSADPSRALVGDDEHGWSMNGVFNLEGGCYAKAINLTEEAEPEIFNAAKYPGAILENVVVNDATGEPDYADGSLTENTRIAYPLDAIPNRVLSGNAPTPKNVVLLTADAYGVLPPIAKLSREQAIYYFLSGYTAKVAGTERGVTEPQATFSACFGAPFMARFPSDYGTMLETRLKNSGASCWLLNTGWTGGGYGVGHRIPLKTTRRILDAALSGELDNRDFRVDPIFKLMVPTEIRGIEPTILSPIDTWRNRDAFMATATMLSEKFADNFRKIIPEPETATDRILLKMSA